MNSILPFAMRAIAHLDSANEHPELAQAIASIVDDHRPLFPDDEDKTMTASFMVAVAYRESTFDNNAIGDLGTSHCAYQIHLPHNAKTVEGWSGEDLRGDAAKCIGVAFRMLKQSMRIDSKAPLAFYARGPNYKSVAAQRLSRDRVALATRTRAAVLSEMARDAS